MGTGSRRRRIGRLSCIAVGIAACMLGCTREKPNATRDLQKHQKKYMDEMDRIAEQMEAEEKAKREGDSDGIKKEESAPAAPTESGESRKEPGDG